MLGSPTALLALIALIIIIGFSSSAQKKDSVDTPLIIYFTQKLLIVSLSMLIIFGIWSVLLTVLSSTGVYVVIGAGLLLTAIFLYHLIKNWNRFERYVSKIVQRAYNHGN